MMLFMSTSSMALSPLVEVQKTSLNKVMNLTEATGTEADMIRNDFIYLQNNGIIPGNVELMIKEKSSLASAVSEQLIVINVKLAKYDRLDRLFVLAHEAGHIVNADREDTNKLFNLYIPDNLTKTEAYHRFNELKPKLCEVLHRHEYAADDYSTQSLLKLGYAKEEIVIAVANVLEDLDSDLTHPASSDRIKRQKK